MAIKTASAICTPNANHIELKALDDVHVLYRYTHKEINMLRLRFNFKDRSELEQDRALQQMESKRVGPEIKEPSRHNLDCDQENCPIRQNLLAKNVMPPSPRFSQKHGICSIGTVYLFLTPRYTS
jgi:hypothetical protein